MPNGLGAQNSNNTPDAERPNVQPPLIKEIIMNKDQVQGRAETAKGAVKEAAGKLVGNDRLTAEGQVDQAAGKVQSTTGDVKNKVGNAVKNAIDR